MKPLLSESQDAETLRELGRASVQIVHDLKNQLNGLKLYATFLRKRLEKHEAPADEQETIAKLIAGLERAAEDTTALVRYGRPVELRLQRVGDLRQIISQALAGDAGGEATLVSAGGTTEIGPISGQFDVTALREAFAAITRGALALRRQAQNGLRGQTGSPSPLEVHLGREQADGRERAFVEWRGVNLTGAAGVASETDGPDPFRSFAGSDALRMALAAKIIRAHGGGTAAGTGSLRVWLPLAEAKA